MIRDKRDGKLGIEVYEVARGIKEVVREDHCTSLPF